MNYINIINELISEGIEAPSEIFEYINLVR